MAFDAMGDQMTDLPHVTAILKDVGLVDTQWFTDYARDRGSALHLATELYDKDDLLISSVVPEILPAFNRYLKFLREMKPEMLAIEKHVTYPGLYQGTLDRNLIIRAKGQGILDIKGGQPSKVDRLQLAGYAMTFPRPMRRWNLYLNVGENYKLVEHEDHQGDNADWMACVRIAAFRRRHNLLKGD